MVETNKPLSAPEQTDKGLPQIGSPENTVRIGDQLIEIKPTKLKYQRNRTAAFYRMLELYPLADILAMEAGTFGDDRDGDKALMDWLIAVTDNEQLILDHYNELDTGVIEQLLQIFRRVNRMDEKEQKQKKPADGQKGVTLDRAVAMIAAHLGVVDEEQINSMSFVFFDDVLTELGYKLTYEAISNYAGNAFCQKSWDMIEKSNPFHIGNPHAGVAMNSLAVFLAKSKITIMGGNQA